MKSPIWPDGSAASQIVVYGLPWAARWRQRRPTRDRPVVSVETLTGIVARVYEGSGRCMSAHIRRLSSAERGMPTRALLVREALQVAGTYEDPKGATDVAREHDQHLHDAYRR